MTDHLLTVQLRLLQTSRKNHADGVIFYTDENNGNGTYYNYAEYDGKKIVLSKNIFASVGTDSLNDYKGTRIITKQSKNTSTMNFYFSGGASSVTCRGTKSSPKNSGLNAYSPSRGERPPYWDSYAAFHYNSTSGYSLIDGSLAKGIVDNANNKLGIFDAMPEGCYVPSIIELETIYYYKDLLASQMKKIGGGFVIDASNAGVSYWSCNTVPDTDNIYYLELKNALTYTVNTTAFDAVKTGTMGGSHRLQYCKKL